MDVIRINERDLVVVAPTGLHKGQSVMVAGREVLALDDILCAKDCFHKAICRAETFSMNLCCLKGRTIF